MPLDHRCRAAWAERPGRIPPGGTNFMRVRAPWLALAVAAAPSTSLAQGGTPSVQTGPVIELLRYEPTGLSLLGPYARGKIPVVFVHGLWSNPASWHRM